MDDCNGAASCSRQEREQFVNFANTFHPAVKFPWTISDTSLSFLDLSVSNSGNHLTTDSHNYFDYISSYPSSCKNAIPYSQFLCICSQDVVFHSRTSQISSYFRD
eukprot:g21349.t1